MENDFKQWVLEASRRPAVVQKVHEIYDQLQAEIDQRRPICQMSGRCCRFKEFGHRLYVTTVEMAAFVADLAAGDYSPSPRVVGGAKAFEAEGRCPFQVGKVCGVHPIRPMGCRIFYCDPTSTQWQQDRYELFHAQIKALHEELGITYAYVEMLSALGSLGLGPAPQAPDGQIQA